MKNHQLDSFTIRTDTTIANTLHIDPVGKYVDTL